MAEQWRLDQGYVVGCAIGTQITLEREGGEIRLLRPPVGLVLRLPAVSTQQESSGDQLRLINKDESIDITLTRVGPPDDRVESIPAAEPGRPRDWPLALRRLALGAVVVGAVASLLLTVLVVSNDLPPGSANAVGIQIETALDRNLSLAFNVLLPGLVLVAFGVGWRLRGFGIMGAALGAAVGGYLGFVGGDQVALLLNAHSSPLSEVGGESMATFVIGAVWIFMIPAVVVIGLVGAGIGALVRSLRRTLRRTSAG
jgi:hypothetical protein